MPWGVIDDEAVEHARELLGMQLRRDRWKWVSEASLDAILHYAEGMGDSNPLWNDRTYAQRTRWGTLLAPPTFLYAVDATTVAPRLPGVQWIYAGTDWVWYDVIRLGDEIDSVSIFLDQKEKSGRFADRWILQSGKTDYINRRTGSIIGTAVAHCARLPRAQELERLGKPKKYEKRGPHTYSADEIKAIEAEALNEQARGAELLYVEDVTVGDTVPRIVRGPLTSTDIIGYYAGTLGTRPYGGTHAAILRYRERHEDFLMSKETGVRDSAGRGHIEASAGDDVGMGGAYDLGIQRVSWAGTLLTNWAGDGGFLHKLSVRLLRPVLIGDTTWWSGRVTAVHQDTGLVDLELEARNQFDDVTAKGSGTVLLPRRGYPVRLPLVAEGR